MLAIANYSAREGRAADGLPAVVSDLRARWRDFQLCAYRPPFDLTPAIQRELANPTPQIVAVGGDGTLNRVLSVILRLSDDRARHVMLGAVGLGSSNDAVKPPTQRVAGWPAKIDPARARAVDVLRVTCRSAPGGARVRHALANVSVGAIAEANRRFNETGAALRALKRLCPSLAIHHVALRTIASWRGIDVRLEADGQPPRHLTLDTLSALKSPWIAGRFHYDVPIARDDGRFAVCLCEGVGRWGLLRLLRDLGGGKFAGKHGRHSFAARALRISAGRPLALECDGDVEEASEAHIEIVPGAILWMG